MLAALARNDAIHSPIERAERRVRGGTIRKYLRSGGGVQGIVALHPVRLGFAGYP